MKNSSDEFYDAAVPDWEVLGGQHLYVGRFSYAPGLRQEFYGACCFTCVLWCS